MEVSGGILSPGDTSHKPESLHDVTNRPVMSPGHIHPAPVSHRTSGGSRGNQVGHVMVHRVPIVSLVIDGKERLCLAQISNTLLKKFSYNEIHNRRVALGITCVQCTPVQLEILRRAGAMPVSSRRCGMITRREAERLVRSFLEEVGPPRLPEDFAFECQHACGWGCRGSFMPSRYNSSRAKCIKCCYCSAFFSPNKFIFHFHRTPESVYNHPDAANFNSWRRHLFLQEPHDEELQHAWEDVKAMFNGGSRKRELPHTSHPPSSHVRTVIKSPPKVEQANPGSKKAKLEAQAHHKDAAPVMNTGIHHSPQIHQFAYPIFPVANRVVPVQPMPTPYILPLRSDKDDRLANPSFTVWPPQPKPMCPPYETIWAKHLGLSHPENVYPPPVSPGAGMMTQKISDANFGALKTSVHAGAHGIDMLRKDYPHTSAFKRVGGWTPDITAAGTPHVTREDMLHGRYSDQSTDVAPDSGTESESEHVDVDTVCDNDTLRDRTSKTEHEINNNTQALENEACRVPVPVFGSMTSSRARSPPEFKGPSHTLGQADIVERSRDRGVIHVVQQATLPHPPKIWQMIPMTETGNTSPEVQTQLHCISPKSFPPCTEDNKQYQTESGLDNISSDSAHGDENKTEANTILEDPRDDATQCEQRLASRGIESTVRSSSAQAVMDTYDGQRDLRPDQTQSDVSELSENIDLQNRIEVSEHDTNEEKISDPDMTKDELLEKLNMAVEAKRKLEDDCKSLTDTLFRKLNEEREVRYSLQQKLKEAHDTLHGIPYKMTSSVTTGDCVIRETVATTLT